MTIVGSNLASVKIDPKIWPLMKNQRNQARYNKDGRNQVTCFAFADKVDVCVP